MEYETLIVRKDKDNGIATITLNRPEKLNAMNVELIDELADAARELGQDNEVRVVVITGAGRGFCSGGDLSSSIYTMTDSAEVYRFMDGLAQMAINIRTMPKPVITSINGVAAGGGCNLALTGDIIIASDQARFSEIFITRNIHPDTGGTYFLPRLVGTHRAMELMLTGRMIDAEEAARIGLVNRVVPADQLENVTKELAKTIAKAAPAVVSMIKKSIYEGVAVDLPAALENETRANVIVMISGVSQEGVKAFTQKEKK